VPSQALYSMLAGYRQVVARLPEVKQPLLLIRSREDHVVPATSSATILERVSTPDPVELVLEDSYHVATLDNEAETIFKRSVEFIHQVTAFPPAADGVQT
jgi:carboxylesterase